MAEPADAGGLSSDVDPDREALLAMLVRHKVRFVPRSTLYELARRGALPARQIGRRWIFRRSLLDRADPPPV